METNTLERLLQETPEAAYWLGFLMADGNFSDSGRVTLRVAVADIDHVYKLQIFLGTMPPRLQRRGTVVGVSCQDPLKVQRIRERFDLVSQKTYNPPESLPYKDSRLLLAFLVGFADGDGCLQYQPGRKDCKLTIKVHVSWASFFRMLDDTLGGIGTSTYSSGYYQYGIYDNRVLGWMRAFLEKEHLPVLRRKWDKVDISESFRKPKQLARRMLARSMFNGGHRPGEIAKATGLSAPDVSRIRRQMGIAPFRKGA